jgi:hypothetical protein
MGEAKRRKRRLDLPPGGKLVEPEIRGPIEKARR